MPAAPNGRFGGNVGHARADAAWHVFHAQLAPARLDVSSNHVEQVCAQRDSFRGLAAKVTIAEVEELVEVGELDPNHVHTPGIYVSRIYVGDRYEKRIERRTVTP